MSFETESLGIATVECKLFLYKGHFEFLLFNRATLHNRSYENFVKTLNIKLNLFFDAMSSI